MADLIAAAAEPIVERPVKATEEKEIEITVKHVFDADHPDWKPIKGMALQHTHAYYPVDLLKSAFIKSVRLGKEDDVMLIISILFRAGCFTTITNLLVTACSEDVSIGYPGALRAVTKALEASEATMKPLKDTVAKALRHKAPAHGPKVLGELLRAACVLAQVPHSRLPAYAANVGTLECTKDKLTAWFATEFKGLETRFDKDPSKGLYLAWTTAISRAHSTRHSDGDNKALLEALMLTNVVHMVHTKVYTHSLEKAAFQALGVAIKQSEAKYEAKDFKALAELVQDLAMKKKRWSQQDGCFRLRLFLAALAASRPEIVNLHATPAAPSADKIAQCVALAFDADRMFARPLTIDPAFIDKHTDFGKHPETPAIAALETEAKRRGTWDDGAGGGVSTWTLEEKAKSHPTFDKKQSTLDYFLDEGTKVANEWPCALTAAFKARSDEMYRKLLDDAGGKRVVKAKSRVKLQSEWTDWLGDFVSKTFGISVEKDEKDNETETEEDEDGDQKMEEKKTKKSKKKASEKKEKKTKGTNKRKREEVDEPEEEKKKEKKPRNKRVKTIDDKILVDYLGDSKNQGNVLPATQLASIKTFPLAQLPTAKLEEGKGPDDTRKKPVYISSEDSAPYVFKGPYLIKSSDADRAAVCTMLKVQALATACGVPMPPMNLYVEEEDASRVWIVMMRLSTGKITWKPKKHQSSGRSFEVVQLKEAGIYSAQDTEVVSKLAGDDPRILTETLLSLALRLAFDPIVGDTNLKNVLFSAVSPATGKADPKGDLYAYTIDVTEGRGKFPKAPADSKEESKEIKDSWTKLLFSHAPSKENVVKMEAGIKKHRAHIIATLERHLLRPEVSADGQVRLKRLIEALGAV